MYKVLPFYSDEDATMITVAIVYDQYDVDAASKQLQYHLNRSVVRNFSAVVINLGQSSFDKWPQNTVVYRVNSLDADHIADIVCNSVCGEWATISSYTVG
ncbi:hypothetical protein TELCIR_16139 [Teladorsagia circumcincta]|uniref:Uncharacterized protein n=1 Tax=Teladorsagia circumcincta TaxID=45464 RepID=A0A2G9TWB0_TELCI|nr:hypothetical protein TELCIR_16139 [Teladorsagia circumcincta]